MNLGTTYHKFSYVVKAYTVTAEEKVLTHKFMAKSLSLPLDICWGFAAGITQLLATAQVQKLHMSSELLGTQRSLGRYGIFY